MLQHCLDSADDLQEVFMGSDTTSGSGATMPQQPPADGGVDTARIVCERCATDGLAEALMARPEEP